MTTTVALQLSSNNSAGENDGSFIFHSIDIEPGSIPGTGDATENKTDKNPCLHEAHLLSEGNRPFTDRYTDQHHV